MTKREYYILYVLSSYEYENKIVFDIVNHQVNKIFVCCGDIQVHQSIETMSQSDKARFVGSVIGIDVKDTASLDDLIRDYIAKLENDSVADRVVEYKYGPSAYVDMCKQLKEIVLDAPQIPDTDERREKQAQRRALKAYNHFQNCRKYNVVRNMSKNMRQRH